jgi:hypothetical protein
MIKAHPTKIGWQGKQSQLTRPAFSPQVLPQDAELLAF